jgi:hypothetical protein
MAQNEDKPCGIVTLYDPKNSSYNDKLFFIENNSVESKNFDQVSSAGVMLALDYYHIQAAVFNGAVFFAMLRPDDEIKVKKRISYLVWVE